VIHIHHEHGEGVMPPFRATGLQREAAQQVATVAQTGEPVERR
jgi:hypothetical protein